MCRAVGPRRKSPSCHVRFVFETSSMPNANYDLVTLRGDVFGGITPAVIALPVALLSQSPPG